MSEATTKIQEVAADGVLVLRCYSDDTVILEGPGIDIDHDACGGSELRLFELKQPDGSGVILIAQFRGDTGWIVGARPLDEDKPFRAPVTLRQDYTHMQAEVAVPRGTVVTFSIKPGAVRR